MDSRELGCSAITRRFLSVAIALSLFSLPLAAAAQKEDNSLYRQTVAEAVQEFKIGNFEEACSLFRRAHSMNPNARTLRGLGMASFEARHYADAITALQAALDESRKPLTEEQRREVEKLLKRAQGFVDRLELHVEPASAVVLVNGREPVLRDGQLTLDPGRHEIVVEAEGYETLTRQLMVSGGGAGTLKLVLKAKPAHEAKLAASGEEGGTALYEGTASEPERATPRDGPGEASGLLPWIVLGGSGIVAVGGAVLLAVALNDVAAVEEAEDGTAWADVEDAYDRAPAFSAAGIALLSAGIAGVATGIVLLTLQGAEERSQLSLTLRPNGLELGGAL